MEHGKSWYKLDNVAKLFPSSARGGDTRVFRLMCELNEPVDGRTLQEALDAVIADFPHLKCVLRKGLFWYYLDYRDIRAIVSNENLNACSALYYGGRKNLLFRVNFFGNRINLEMFHVLADGTGAFIFFKALITKYLSLRHNFLITDAVTETASAYGMGSDAFDRFYEPKKFKRKAKKERIRNAYHIKGTTDDNLLPHLVEGTVSVKSFIDIAHKYNTTVGILATSVYIAAVIDEMTLQEQSRPIVVSVPVNLRNYFKSETARNFFGVIRVTYDARNYDGELSTIIKAVKQSFDFQLSKDRIAQTMNNYSALEHNLAIKMVPLWIKDFSMGRYNRLIARGVTSTMSNLGTVGMPEPASSYIVKFGAFMTAPFEQVSIVSFKDRMVIGEVSSFVNHEVMLHFYRRLTELGLSVEIATNDNDN